MGNAKYYRIYFISKFKLFNYMLKIITYANGISKYNENYFMIMSLGYY